jgi:hypothetical protein
MLIWVVDMGGIDETGRIESRSQSENRMDTQIRPFPVDTSKSLDGCLEKQREKTWNSAAVHPPWGKSSLSIVYIPMQWDFQQQQYT